jgi:hypothetical protein
MEVVEAGYREIEGMGPELSGGGQAPFGTDMAHGIHGSGGGLTRAVDYENESANHLRLANYDCLGIGP